MNSPAERRSEPRREVDRYYSVEFSMEGMEYIYQFKIWNISSKGLCVVAKEDSDILKHLKAGDRLKLKYYSTAKKHPMRFMETEIKHITRDVPPRFRGHCLIGFEILDAKTA